MNYLKTITLFLFLVLIASFIPSGIYAQEPPIQLTREEILNYDSKIELNEDAKINVNETIEVVALGQEIRRGIYRDYPTDYRDDLGLYRNTTFDVIGVLKNGEPEPFFTERMVNGMRLYIGEEDVFLQQGIYAYNIDYETSNQISFNEEFDRFKYNVTGSGWIFPIQSSSATVLLPSIIDHEKISAKAYVGSVGSESSSVEIIFEDIEGKTQITFINPEPVQPGEDFSIDIELPKEVIDEPSDLERILLILRDNFPSIIFVVSSLVILGVAIIAWYLKGRDPDSKSVYPQYTIPEGISPGSARFVMRMAYDNTILASVIADLGAKGFLKVNEESEKGILSRKKYYTITKLKDDISELPDDERVFMEEFFRGDRVEVTFGDSYSAHIESAAETFKNHYEKKVKPNYFSYNLQITTIIGVLVGANLIIYLLLQNTFVQNYDFISTISTFVGSILIFTVGFLIFQKYRSRFGAGLFAVFGGGILFIMLLIVFLLDLAGAFSVLFVLPAAVISGFTIIFTYYAMKARKKEGKELETKLLGLKMFINAAEDEKIKIMNKDFPKNMDTFNKYFPYALAFGLELKWAEQFKDVIKAAQADPTSDTAYNIGWYYGIGSFNSSSFTNSMSSNISSSIAASSTPPSSSGSGGGFAGGGGGGGGGGGW